MSNPHDEASSEAGRALAQRRWGDSVIRRAISELAERQDQLDSEQRRALAFLAGDPKGQRDD
jgi:hypothetical protein